MDKIKAFAKAQNVEKEEKQIIPMSIIMTADEISEKYLFQDGVRLDMKTCCDLLKNRGEVSEHKRAYQYLKETIIANPFRFLYDQDRAIEQWGIQSKVDGEYFVMVKYFDKIMKDAGFQTKAFLSWAKKNNLVQVDGAGNPTKPMRINGSKVRCVVIDLNHDEDEWKDTIDSLDVIPFD